MQLESWGGVGVMGETQQSCSAEFCTAIYNFSTQAQVCRGAKQWKCENSHSLAHDSAPGAAANGFWLSTCWAWDPTAKIHSQLLVGL